MKVAITGGAGFIGSEVCRQAIERGWTPVVIDRHGDQLLDVRSKEAAYAIMECDAVIHLAGMLGTEELFDTAEEAVDENVKGTLAVLRAAEAGEMRYVSITMPDCWRNPYQATKRCALDLAEAWREHRKLEVAHVRAYNVFGPGQKVGTPRKIIPTFASAGWAGDPIRVWGDGSQTVDLIHVRDVARMLLDAADGGTRWKNPEPLIYEAGSGTALTVELVAGMVALLTNKRSEIVHEEMRAGETAGVHVVAKRPGHQLLNWTPKFTFEDLEATVESYRP